MRDVIVVTGAGQIGQAIARRTGVGKHVVLADLRLDNANAAAEVLGNAGYEVSVAAVDVSSREAVHALVERARSLGEVTGLIHAAGVSPSQASPATRLRACSYSSLPPASDKPWPAAQGPVFARWLGPGSGFRPRPYRPVCVPAVLP